LILVRTLSDGKIRASFPPAFTAMFEASPKATAKIKKAPFIDHDSKYGKLSWNTGTPKLLPVETCIEGDLPSSEALWDLILETVKPQDSVQVVINLEEQGQECKHIKWAKVVGTLLKEIGRSAEGTSAYAAVFSLPLPEGEVQVVLPEKLKRTITTPDLAKAVSANIGFTDQWVYFHIDTGHGGISALAGDCEKIWLFAPAVAENLALLQGDDISIPYLASRFSKLGVIRQTAADAIFLPPGIIHATFTVKTGILYGNNFCMQENIYGFTIGMLYVMGEADAKHVWSERDAIIRRWIDVMEDIKKHGDEDQCNEALVAFRLSEMRDARRKGVFKHWGAEIDKLAEGYYPKARLRDVQGGDGSDGGDDDDDDSEGDEGSEEDDEGDEGDGGVREAEVEGEDPVNADADAAEE
jgi:hypothetical protein